MLPELKTAIPGPKSLQLATRLRQYESRNVTYVDETWPIFWDRAQATNVWDVDGNRFLDFTSAFGVAGLGHRHPEVVDAMLSQSQRLLHGMGDVHPTQLKVDLCAKLSEVTFERWGSGSGKVILSNSGFEAIESALKTARLATGKSGILAFERGYHGLGYGSLLGTALDRFREPFDDQLAQVTTRLPYGVFDDPDPQGIGVVLVEPVQGRGGKVMPPSGFLEKIRRWCDQHGVILVFDEIYTGFHRTGALFAADWVGVVPDLICVGKALSGGFPISACVGKMQLMDAWPESTGEAIHTSTYLGHPVGCAMALKSLEILERSETIEKVGRTGAYLQAKLESLKWPQIVDVRGRGMMWGVELQENAGPLLGRLLAKGLLFLADGPEGNVLSFTPPFSMDEQEIDFALGEIEASL